MSEIEPLFGPMLIGVFLNTILYGVLAVQTFIYFQTYKRDVAWIRYLMVYLFIAETMNTVCYMYLIYEPLVQRYGSPSITIHIPLMFPADPITTALISTPVQIFIAWRIRIINGSNLIMGMIVFFALCSFAGALTTATLNILTPEFSELPKVDPAVITWLGSSVAADLIITPSLIWSLYKRKTGIAATDDIINRLMRMTLQTGLLTAIAATVDLVLFVAVPEVTINFILAFILGKLYTNSLLSTLNARAGWGNLTGNTNQPNALFGDERTSARRTQRETSQGISSAAFELESQSTRSRGLTEGHDRVLGDGDSAKAMERLQDALSASLDQFPYSPEGNPRSLTQ